MEKKFVKQTTHNLYSHMVNVGYASSRLLSSFVYDRGTMLMDILQPKFDKHEGDLMPNEYDTKKFTFDLNSLQHEDKI
jgi:hypothetical protein